MGKSSQKTIYGNKTPAEVRAAIQMICKENDYDPFKELITMAKATVPTEIDGKIVELPICTVDQKIAIAKEIAAYIAPKIKNIEVKQEIDGEFTFRIINHSAGAEPSVLPDLPAERKKLRQGVLMPGEEAPIQEAEVLGE